MLLSQDAFRPRIFFTSKDGTTLAAHPFETNSAQVIVGGIIPDTYFIKKGVLKQKTRKPSISVTTQDEETGTNHLPNTALITTNPAETVNKPKPQTTPKKSKPLRGSKPTRKDELYRPSKSQRQHIRNYVNIQPHKLLTPRGERKHIKIYILQRQ